MIQFMKMNQRNQKKEVPFELRYLASQLKLHGLSYKDVADRLKVDPSLISHILNGTGKSDAVLVRLRKLVNA